MASICFLQGFAYYGPLVFHGIILISVFSIVLWHSAAKLVVCDGSQCLDIVS